MELWRFIVLGLNKPLNKQSRFRQFDTSRRPCNVIRMWKSHCMGISHRSPFWPHELTLFTAWTSNRMPVKCAKKSFTHSYRLILGTDKLLHHTLYNECKCLSYCGWSKCKKGGRWWWTSFMKHIPNGHYFYIFSHSFQATVLINISHLSTLLEYYLWNCQF